MVLDPGHEERDILRINRSREKKFAFDHVFDDHVLQYEVYQAACSHLVDSVQSGINCTVFAYGSTGSGKTFTMLGTVEDPGCNVFMLRDLFSAFHSDQLNRYRVKISYLEVYNELIRDLMVEESEFLDLREDPQQGAVVSGLTELQLDSVQEVLEKLQEGNLRRTQEPTSANPVSSRSHAVLQVVVESEDINSGMSAKIFRSKLSMVDLAGSERASHTQNRGIRMIEGARINRSLLALGNCINALVEQRSGSSGTVHIPYRDSKLTRLLKDSLGGNTRTVMIAAVAPSEIQFEETVNTLKYANRAKNIQTNVCLDLYPPPCLSFSFSFFFLLSFFFFL